MAAMAYLATLPNYSIFHRGKYAELQHYGHYGYCSGGSYGMWKLIHRVDFYEEE